MTGYNIEVDIVENKLDARVTQQAIDVELLGDAIFNIAVFEWVTPPATRNSPGLVGQMSFDDDWFYLCVAPSYWKRTTLQGGW